MYKAPRYWLALLAFVNLAACSYEPSFTLTCADEGAREGDRVCTDGVWIAELPTVMLDMDMDLTPDGSTGDVTVPAPDMSMCTQESDEAFCTRLGLTCDEVTQPDNCGIDRTANCGVCTGQATCGGGGSANVCACAAQSDTEFCASYAKTCDPYTDIDACGEMRTVNCGMCMGLEICGADNTCQCDTPTACVTLDANCGMIDVTGMCGGTNSITCGTCDDANAACDVTSRCACDPGFAGDGLTCLDVDECADGTDDCDVDASCANNSGGFTCTCNPGFTGDGKTCSAIPRAAMSVQLAQLSTNGSADTASITPVARGQAVPFATMRLTDTDADGDDVAVDVFLSANNEVTISRGSSTGTVDVTAYIVEFDPSEATVQNGTFSVSNFTGVVNLPTSVDAQKSFVVFYFEHDNATEDKDDFLLSGDLNAGGTAIDFVRGSNTGTLSGHWWVVESVDTAFDVRRATGSMSGLSTNIGVSAVTTAKSFLLYSYTTDHNDNDAERAQARCNLASPTNVQCRRSLDTNSVTDIRVQVVTLNGFETVQRGTEPVNGGLATAASNLTAVDATSMAFGGQLGSPGVTMHATSSGTETPGGYFTHVLTGNGTGIELRRGSPRAASASVTWQVVDW